MTNIGSDKPNNYDNDPVKGNYAENDNSNIMINIIRSIKNSNNKESNNDNGIPQWNKKNNGSATGYKTSW